MDAKRFTSTYHPCNVDVTDGDIWLLGDKRETPALLQKYEEAAVVGRRGKDISEGALILILLTEGEDDAMVIARKELLCGVLRGNITRIHSNGVKEYWNLRELKLPANPAEPWSTETCIEQ